MPRRALVIGGTGPTGRAIVESLLRLGDAVTIYHTGRHEAAFSAPVDHIHGDPRDLGRMTGDLGGLEFDVAVCTSGRLRHQVQVLAGRVAKLVAITGLHAYRGALRAPGAPGPLLPIRETDPLVESPGEDRIGHLVVLGERDVLARHRRGDFDATILRYTMVYGPHAYIPFEWFLVRRVLDRRPVIALEGDGLMVPQRGYSENLARAVMLDASEPAAGGQVYKVGDERALSLQQLVEVAAAALGHTWTAVPIPLRESPCRNPFAMRQNTIFDLAKIRSELGYSDVTGVEEATALTMRWLRDNPIAPGSPEELSLGDHAFDYGREDAAIARYS